MEAEPRSASGRDRKTEGMEADSKTRNHLEKLTMAKAEASQTEK